MQTFQFSNINVFSYSLILFLIVSLIPTDVQSIRLDADGGYSVLVGIDSFESQPDLENLIQSIKDAFTDMSSRMSNATQRFYIKNVDILLRSHSDLVETDADAVSEHYKAADFQISRNVLEPEVANPNGCGLPGSRLSLPLESFDSPASEISGKALLHLFARYRWGVFEEGGSEYDTDRYPQFYRTTNDESSWVHTVCSNAPIIGSFEPSEGEKACDLTNLEEYPSNCKFVPAPSEEQTASSSLMNYYWLDSITNFCNESTHNTLAPNPQNILCSYRSVMEVIKSTKDWSETELPENVPDPVFRVLGVSQKPRLYFLLDRGWSVAPEIVITRIKTQLAEMLESLDSSIVMGIGAFPSNTTDSDIDSLLEWSMLENSRSRASELINQNFGIGIGGNGNFVTALFQLTKIIQAIDHPFGTAIVILKSGSAESYENAPYEYDIISSLNALPTKVYALEIQGNAVQPGVNLVNLVETIGGSHTIINDLVSTPEKLDAFLQRVVEQFQTPNVIPEKYITHVFKGYMDSSTYEHDLGANMKTSQVSLASSKPLTSVRVSLNEVTISMQKSVEWSDTSVNGKREVYYGSVASSPDIGGKISVSFECEEDEACGAFLVVTGDRDEVNGEELISVEISTSWLTNEVDWSEPGSEIRPFHIYARVSKSDDSIIEDINGIVCPIRGEEKNPTNECQSIAMVDDGLGDPDILKNDGIYSLTFVPRQDDRYNVRVICTVAKDVERETLRATRSFDYNGLITFAGVSNFQPVVRRIVDLTVVNKMEDTVTLTWTSPVIYEFDGEDSPADTYEIRYTNGPDYTLLLKDFENCPEISSPNPSRPGTIESITVEDSEERFYAIRALYSTAKGEVSNIVSSAFASQTTDPPTTDPPTTTTSPPTTDPTTTDIPTTDPSTTDPPTTDTTTTDLPTTDSSTTDPPTTSSPTTGPSTTDIPTTDPPTTDPSTTDPATTDPPITESPTTTTEFSTSSSVTGSTSQSSTPSFTRPSTTPPSTTSKRELFFKKPIGYITAAVGGVAVVAVIGGSVAYLYWKRKMLMDSGRLKLV